MYILLMLLSIMVNMWLCIFGEKHQKQRRAIFILSIVFNLGILGYYKYAGFLVSMFQGVLPFLMDPVFQQVYSLQLPAGISFFTFQAMSYAFDVYRKEVKPQTNALKLGLYISFFPQIIAGPIVRYSTISQEINTRTITLPSFYNGVKRFILGLGKKVLIANNMAIVADSVFTSNPSTWFAGLSWLGIICYSLQIYFDFSGYSDMAIGLGKMFGFNFLENFNYTYIATTIKDFWKRWHISLSSWFMDYLYIPLGGNRNGKLRTQLNLLIVFVLCGFWHGAAWNFVIWGLYHGLFLVIERIDLVKKVLNTSPTIVKHIYTIVVIMIGWVFFRLDTMTDALLYIKSMFVFTGSNSVFKAVEFCNTEVWIALALGLFMCTPIAMLNFQKLSKIEINVSGICFSVGYLAEAIALSTIMLLCLASIAAGTYSPFIYFRF